MTGPAPVPRTDKPDAPPPVPRWVKGLLIAIVAAALVVLVVMLLAGGEHRPGMHGSLGSGAVQVFGAPVVRA